MLIGLPLLLNLVHGQSLAVPEAVQVMLHHALRLLSQALLLMSQVLWLMS